MTGGFDIRGIVKRLYNPEKLIEELEGIDDDLAADFLASQVGRLSEIDMTKVRAELPGYLRQYEEFRDGRVNNLMAIVTPEMDSRVRRAFADAEHGLEMLEGRFYSGGVYVGDQLKSREEHEAWYSEFNKTLSSLMSAAIMAYREIKPRLQSDSMIRGSVEKALRKAGYDIDLRSLPDSQMLVRLAKKVTDIYRAYERHEMERYAQPIAV
jgi:hypothetical protein